MNNLFIRSLWRYLASRRCRLRRNSFPLSGISSLAWRYRICRLDCIQPVQMDDGPFRLHRHVVNSNKILLVSKKRNAFKSLIKSTWILIGWRIPALFTALLTWNRSTSNTKIQVRYCEILNSIIINKQFNKTPFKIYWCHFSGMAIDYMVSPLNF